MIMALKELSIRGDISTTVDYISQLIELPDFKNNKFDTGWLDELISRGSLQDIESFPSSATPTASKNKLNPHLLISLASTIVAFKKCTEDEATFMASLEKGQLPPASLLEPIRKVELIYDSIKYARARAKRAQIRVVGGGAPATSLFCAS